MHAAVNLILLDRKLLYDGLDEGFYQFVFNPQISDLPPSPWRTVMPISYRS